MSTAAYIAFAALAVFGFAAFCAFVLCAAAKHGDAFLVTFDDDDEREARADLYPSSGRVDVATLEKPR